MSTTINVILKGAVKNETMLTENPEPTTVSDSPSNGIVTESAQQQQADITGKCDPSPREGYLCMQKVATCWLSIAD